MFFLYISFLIYTTGMIIAPTHSVERVKCRQQSYIIIMMIKHFVLSKGGRRRLGEGPCLSKFSHQCGARVRGGCRPRSGAMCAVLGLSPSGPSLDWVVTMTNCRKTQTELTCLSPGCFQSNAALAHFPGRQGKGSL